MKEEETVESQPAKGGLGNETDWLSLCELSLVGGKLLIIDPTYTPKANEGLVVDLSAGKYIVEAKVMDFTGDKRVSRLRVYIPSTLPTLGGKLGEVVCDTSQIGISDHAAWISSWEDDDEASAAMEPSLWKMYGIAVLNQERGAVMPYVSSGFGDGDFGVYELLQESRVVGVEVEFIKPNTPFPF